MLEVSPNPALQLRYILFGRFVTARIDFALHRLCSTWGRLVLQAASWYTCEELHDRCLLFPNLQTWLQNCFASGQLPCSKACNRDLLQLAMSEVLEEQSTLLFLCSSAPSVSFFLNFGYLSRPITDNGRPTRCFRFFRSSWYRTSRQPSILLEEA